MDGYAVWPHQCQATFQHTMDMPFSDMIDYTDIYVDDIVVYSESLEDHLVHLRKVLQRLREHQFFVKLKKCSIRNRVRGLHRVTHGNPTGTRETSDNL